MKRPLRHPCFLGLVLAASLCMRAPAPWVDLMAGWDSSSGEYTHYLRVRLPSGNPRRPFFCTVAKNQGGAGTLATRQWTLFVTEARRDIPAGPDRETWTFADPNKQNYHRETLDYREGRLLASREFGTLLDPPWGIGFEPRPRIYYRRQGGDYQLLTYCQAHPVESWNPSPGWWTCLLNQPWHLSDSRGAFGARQ